MFLTPSAPSTPLASTNPIIQAIHLLKLSLDQSTYKLLALISLLASEGSGVVSYGVLRGAAAASTSAEDDYYDEDSFILNLDDLLDLQLLSHVNVRNGIYISREVRRFVLDEMSMEEFEVCWEGLGSWLVGILESGADKRKEMIGEGKAVIEKKGGEEERQSGECDSECEWMKTKDGKWVMKEPEREVKGQEEDKKTEEMKEKEVSKAPREEYVQCAFALLGAFVEWGKRNRGVGVEGRDRRRGRGVKKLVAKLLGILRAGEGEGLGSGNSGKEIEVGKEGKKVEGRVHEEKGVMAEKLVGKNREAKKEDIAVEKVMRRVETESFGAHNSMAKQVEMSRAVVSVVECAET
ncbi:hypothetical protein ACMFMG_000288 [Clarireedia jacksonii]